MVWYAIESLAARSQSQKSTEVRRYFSKLCHNNVPVLDNRLTKHCRLVYLAKCKAASDNHSGLKSQLLSIPEIEGAKTLFLIVTDLAI